MLANHAAIHLGDGYWADIHRFLDHRVQIIRFVEIMGNFNHAASIA